MTDLDSLRYPVGRFTPVENTAHARAEGINAIALLPKRVCGAVAGLSDVQLDTPYRDGGWTVRQVVHHIADSHANSVIRFKLALTEDWPTIKPYDENAWAQLPDSKLLPLDSSLSFITAMHERWVALLESMSEADFDRGFVHPERGRQTLATALAIYAWHGRHHTAHITALRARNNW
jgi:Mycothiol maleylpyruvate isomerase N-terminal domain.